MRRRALIMAGLLVAPLPLVGGSRRPVFLLRPSPGLRKSVRFSAPLPPAPRSGRGALFVPCGGVGCCSVPFSCPRRPAGRRGLVWLPQLLPPGRRPLALSCSCGRQPLVHRGSLCLRHQSGSVPTAKRANRGHIAARFPPCCLRNTSLVWVRAPMSADSDRKGLQAGEDARPLFPWCKPTCKPHHGSRAM